MCETMARLVCRDSMTFLDVSGMNEIMAVVAPGASWGMVEDRRHLAMQCPAEEDARSEILITITYMDRNFGTRGREEPGLSLHWLLGKAVEGVVDEYDMVRIWLTPGYCIEKMYKVAIKARG